MVDQTPSISNECDLQSISSEGIRPASSVHPIDFGGHTIITKLIHATKFSVRKSKRYKLTSEQVIPAQL